MDRMNRDDAAAALMKEPKPSSSHARRHPFRIAAAIVVTILVILALVLGLYFGLHARGSSSSSSPSSPSSSTSPSPTTSPTGPAFPPATLPASPPASNFPAIQESFVSFAIEFLFFPDFSGNLSAPNTFSDNLLSNIANISGTKPYIRVGGNTQDLAIYSASLPVATQATWVGLHPQDISIGPSFFEGYSSFPGSKFIHGFNMKNATISAIGWKSLLDEVPVTCKAIGSNLLWWEYGNEPDLYPRPTDTWNATTYVSDWHNGTAAIQSSLASACPAIASGSAYGYVGPSLQNTQAPLAPKMLFQVGLNDDGEVKQYTMHHYMGSADDPTVTLQGSLMNHTAVKSKLAWILAEMNNLNSPSLLNPTDTATAIPFTLDEANSLLNGALGPPDLLNVFGSALWTFDYMLYCASIGLSRVHMQQGTGFAYNSWAPIATPDQSIATLPPYYGNIAVAAMLGDLTKAVPQIVEIPLDGVGDFASAYAAYVNGSTLTRVAVVDLRQWNSTQQEARGGGNYSFALPGALGVEDGRVVGVQRLLAAGSDAKTGVTWDGWSYAYELNAGKPVRMGNVTTGETVVVQGGRVSVELVISSAVVLHFA
ncbi:hypothetical protein MMC13_007995 [Lambiella insularis]|nr:hypothetical protein [Lambiella insularis]